MKYILKNMMRHLKILFTSNKCSYDTYTKWHKEISASSQAKPEFLDIFSKN